MVKWQTNDSGMAIPYIEGKPLCSKVNPDREAKAWAERAVGRLYKSTDTLIILGYGAGYHVEELRKITKHNIVVFEVIEEIVSSALEDKQLKVIFFSKVDDVLKNIKLKDMFSKKFQVLQHYPSTSPFLGEYESIRHAITARERSAFKTQVDLHLPSPLLANMNFSESDELLTAKDISTHLTQSKTSNPKSYIWKILGDLLK